MCWVEMGTQPEEEEMPWPQSRLPPEMMKDKEKYQEGMLLESIFRWLQPVVSFLGTLWMIVLTLVHGQPKTLSHFLIGR